jgi:hypothetical protein
MKKFTLVLAVLLMLSAMTASGCVIHDHYYRFHRWHYWR